MMLAYRLQAVDFSYQPGSSVLAVPALEISAGSVTALVGPNAAGKSTLINLLAFIHAPDTGTLYYRDQAVQESHLRTLRRRVALVPQQPYLLQTSVAGNVELGLKIRGIRKAQRRLLTRNMLEQLGMEQLADLPVHELSGGQAQKVAIARALVLEPEVLLFDEPFTYLDKQVMAEFESLILAIREHRAQTVIFSSHDHLRAHALADQVVTLFDGRLAPTSLINHFQGNLDDDAGLFDTGKLKIHVPEGTRHGVHLAVEASQIVVSRELLHSSMRNTFRGRVTGLHEENGRVRMTVQAGENFQVIITRAALRELHIVLGEDVYVSFKSTAVKVF